MGEGTCGHMVDGMSGGDGMADWGSNGCCEDMTGRTRGDVPGRSGYHSILSDGQSDMVMEKEWGRWLRM